MTTSNDCQPHADEEIATMVTMTQVMDRLLDAQIPKRDPEALNYDAPRGLAKTIAAHLPRHEWALGCNDVIDSPWVTR